MLYADGMDITQLTERRERLGLSRRELAIRVGVSHVTIWRWETLPVEPLPIVLAHLDAVLSRLEAERMAS